MTDGMTRKITKDSTQQHLFARQKHPSVQVSEPEGCCFSMGVDFNDRVCHLIKWHCRHVKTVLGFRTDECVDRQHCWFKEVVFKRSVQSCGGG